MIPFFCLGDSNSGSNDLQYVAVPLIDNSKCIRPHTLYDSNRITSNMVCTGNQEDGGVGPCIADAGGPLVVPDSSDADLAVLYGLVSWGASTCAQAQSPEVYTRITPFVGWIRGYMKGVIKAF